MTHALKARLGKVVVTSLVLISLSGCAIPQESADAGPSLAEDCRTVVPLVERGVSTLGFLNDTIEDQSSDRYSAISAELADIGTRLVNAEIGDDGLRAGAQQLGQAFKSLQRGDSTDFANAESRESLLSLIQSSTDQMKLAVVKMSACSE